MWLLAAGIYALETAGMVKRPVTGNNPITTAMLPRQSSNRFHPNTTGKKQTSEAQRSNAAKPDRGKWLRHMQSKPTV